MSVILYQEALTFPLKSFDAEGGGRLSVFNIASGLYNGRGNK